MRAFMIAPTAIIAGLGQSLEIDVVPTPGATGDYRTNLLAKGAKAVELLTKPDLNYQFGFIHVKAVDDAGHDKNAGLKIHFLEKIDVMLGHIIQDLTKTTTDHVQYSVVVTGDHSTPVLSGDHSCEPVPFVIAPLPLDGSSTDQAAAGRSLRVYASTAPANGYTVAGCNSSSATCSSSVRSPLAALLSLDSVDSFNEISAAGASKSLSRAFLGRFPGREVMPLIKRFLALRSSVCS